MPKDADHPRCEVLVIDDDQELRASLEMYLSGEYAVATAGSGREGVRRLSPDSHAVILDIKMKGLDGFATFIELRQRSPDAPIIFFSAYLHGQGAREGQRRAPPLRTDVRAVPDLVGVTPVIARCSSCA